MHLFTVQIKRWGIIPSLPTVFWAADMRKTLPECRNRTNGPINGSEMKITFFAICHLPVNVNSSFDSFQPSLIISSWPLSFNREINRVISGQILVSKLLGQPPTLLEPCNSLGVFLQPEQHSSGSSSTCLMLDTVILSQHAADRRQEAPPVQKQSWEGFSCWYHDRKKTKRYISSVLKSCLPNWICKSCFNVSTLQTRPKAKPDAGRFLMKVNWFPPADLCYHVNAASVMRASHLQISLFDSELFSNGDAIVQGKRFTSRSVACLLVCVFDLSPSSRDLQQL